MPSPARRRSIVDVAVAAGVSTATVSRVLSGRRSKDDDLARRVRRAAEVLHYTANPAASALRAETTAMLGLVIPDPPDSFAAGFVARFVSLAAAQAHQVLLLSAEDLTRPHHGGPSMDPGAHPVFGQAVDGCVMVAVETGGADARLPPALRSTSFPVIWAGVTDPASAPVADGSVGIDLDSTLQLAVARLVERGSRRIALLAPDVESLRGASYFVGFETALAPVHAITRAEWMSFGPTDAERGYADAARMIAEDGDRRPDGIVCVTDAVADGARLALETTMTATEATARNRPRLVTIADRHARDVDGNGAGPSERLRPDFTRMATAALRLLSESKTPDGSPSRSLLPSIEGEEERRGRLREPTTGGSDTSDAPTIAVPMLPEWTPPT